MKHTPGPWTYSAHLTPSENHRGFYLGGGPWPHGIAEVFPIDADGLEGEANARLIAAAPELLNALKAMVGCCTNRDGGVSPEPNDRSVWLGAIINAREVLAKAEG